MRLLAFTFAIARTAGSADAPSHAKRAPHWDPAWRHADAIDYTVGAITTAGLIVETIALQPQRAPLRWSDPILLDEDARNALRLTDRTAHDAVSGVSWGLWLTQLSYPVLVDLPYAWARYDLRLARDLFWQDIVTITIAGAVDLGLRQLAGRARPYTYACLTNGGGASCLEGLETTRSFPGGHTLTGTAASVLTCTQHLYVRLYGAPADAITCAATLTSNATLTVMRVMTDDHWLSDQLVGVGIGALIGFGVPWIMHFHGGTPGYSTKISRSDSVILPAPLAVDRGMGFGVIGIF